jgi:hypothetical protein
MHVKQAYRGVLQKWLDAHSGWRPATIDDAFAAASPDAKDFVKAEIKDAGLNYHPFYAAADFNSDRNLDFALILTTDAPAVKKFAVVIFNGPFKIGQTPVPAFYSEKLGEGDWLFWKTRDGFGNRFIVGPASSDSGYIVKPKGKTYFVE